MRNSQALSTWRERPVEGRKEVRVGEMQVPRGRGDVGMAHQTLDDVDLLAPAHEARGVGVTPAVWVVPTRHARRGPALEDQIVQRPSPVATAEVAAAFVHFARSN